jgi:hypothetical protein
MNIDFILYPTKKSTYWIAVRMRYGSLHSSKKPYYLNKITALKKRSSILNEDLKSLFERQKGVLEKIESMTKAILETNLEIVNESK